MTNVVTNVVTSASVVTTGTMSSVPQPRKKTRRGPGQQQGARRRSRSADLPQVPPGDKQETQLASQETNNEKLLVREEQQLCVCSRVKVSQRRPRAPTRGFSWLKLPTSTFKTLLRH